MKSYTGIGSRKTPIVVCKRMTEIASYLRVLNLRSGDAVGADTAFQKGAKHKEIFHSSDARPWAFDMVQKYLPPGYKWDEANEYTQGLLARNMMSVLGRNGDDPSLFVVCWTRNGKDVGGTGYAIRCAIDHGIPVFNLKTENGSPWIDLLENNFDLLF